MKHGLGDPCSQGKVARVLPGTPGKMEIGTASCFLVLNHGKELWNPVEFLSGIQKRRKE